MRIRNVYHSLVHKVGHKTQVYLNKPSKSKQTKALINQIIGKEHVVVRPLEDLGGISSTIQLFSLFTTHYAAFIGKFKRSFAFAKYYTHHISVDYDSSKNVKSLQIYNLKDGDVAVYDKFGNMIKYHSPEEADAVQYYKKNSKNIHKLLRYGIKPENEIEIKRKADIISNIFRFNYKVQEAVRSFYTYRALDPKALKEIMSMPEDGMIYIEPSFLSVATKKRSILLLLKFRNFRHIMRLKVYKGAKYIDVDKMSKGRILGPVFPENELIFPKGSKILIKKRNGRHGIIDAELIKN